MLLTLIPALGCVGLPHPTPLDAERAKVRWTDANVSTLEAGRSAYVARCSGCHTLRLPQSKPPETWSKVLDEMEKEVQVAPDERLLIEKFLVTMSEHQPD